MVSKVSLLIGSNIRKSKSRLVVVSLLCILAAILLNIVFILSFDYSENFFTLKDAADGPDIVYNYADLSGTVSAEELTAAILNKKGVKDTEVSETYACSAESEFGEGSVLKMFTFYSESNFDSKRLDRIEILESDESCTDGIYLSYIYQAAAHYQTGDKITITVRNHPYEYTIKGFYNSVSTGTNNCIDVSCILSDGLYEELLPSLTPMYRIAILIDDGVSTGDLTRDISTDLASDYPGLTLYHTQTVEDAHTARYSNAMLFQTILLASSILIIAVLLIMIAIVLSNFIKNGIVTLGTLKAIGYTSASLILPIILEFAIIIVISSVIGIGGSYAIFPMINRALESQIGIPYQITFSIGYGLYTVLVILVTGVITVYLSVRKIRHIEPINAIKTRKSIQKTSNLFSLEKTGFGLNTAIGFNTCLSSFSRNFVISVCYIMVSFLIAFSFFLYANVIKKSDDVIELVCGQFPDCTISVSAANTEKVVGDLESDPDVDNFYQYTCRKVVPDTGIMLSLYLTEDSSVLNADRILIKGRLPENDNEVALNKRYATDNGLGIGDELTFTVDNEKIGFTVVGFTQGAYYLGNDGYILVDGYKRIDDPGSVSYYVNLKNGCDIDSFVKTFKEKSPVNSATNEYKYFEANATMYKSLLIILCIAIVALSLIISSFVLYVLISIMLENKRREHGILKSLGFVTRDIIYQVNLSVLPFAFVATVIGTVLSKKLTDPILSSLLNSIGIFSFGKEITSLQAILCIVFITAFTILYTVLSSAPIKKISPHELFNRE